MGHQITRPLGQAVKTPPFHGGNRGSIPLGVTNLGLIAQLGEHLPYKQGVTGSSPVEPTKKINMVVIEKRIHLFPFRTQKLSSSSPMVLGPQGPGRVGRSQLVAR